MGKINTDPLALESVAGAALGVRHAQSSLDAPSNRLEVKLIGWTMGHAQLLHQLRSCPGHSEARTCMQSKTSVQVAGAKLRCVAPLKLHSQALGVQPATCQLGMRMLSVEATCA